MSPGRRIPASGLLGLAVGAAVLAVGLDQPLPSLPAHGTVPAGPAAPPVAPVRPVNPLDRQVIVERPLFTPGRRPPAPEGIDPAAPPLPAPEPVVQRVDVVLHGVARTADSAVALIVYPGEPHLKRITVGDTVSGWRVKAITRNSITLSLGEQEHTVGIAKIAGD